MVALQKRASVPGTGWGCVVCGLSANGALAVLCDICVSQKPLPGIKFAIDGYARNKARISLSLLEQDFLHDERLHRRLEEVEELNRSMEEYTTKSSSVVEIIEVHNVWTIYGVDDDGDELEEPISQHSRPQDWGSPKWRYERFRFEWLCPETHYINHVHCWTDLVLDKSDVPRVFAPLITQILMPGCKPELCDRSYLAEEDFWDEEWGPAPPMFFEAEEDDF